MRLLRTAFIFFMAVLPALAFAKRARAPRETTEEKVYQWLVSQQNQETGLLGNQEDDDFSGIYPNALAALCYVHEGDTVRARRIFDFFKKQFDTRGSTAPFGGFHQFWNAATGEVFADTDLWIGDNAWLLIALNYYRKKSGNTEYDAVRAAIADWMVSLQDSDGGIWSGFNKTGPIGSKSTEGNLDAYAALIDRPEARAKVKQFLLEKMWVPEDKRFRMGSTVDESAMDCTSWAICSLGKEYASTLGYAEKKFARVSIAEGSKKKVAAFSDFVDKKRVWLEGSGQMAVAYHVAGKPAKAQQVLKEMQNAMVKSPRFKGAMGLPCSTEDPSWQGATTKIFVPSQTWYLMGVWKFNPMAEGE